jgi:chromosome partitioning protein
MANHASTRTTQLAGTGASVTIIDADPNKNVVDWAKLPGVPATLTVIGDATEESIVDQIEQASATTTFVIVDLEGTASLLVSYAISMADFVVIPVQGSQLDAKQAARQMKLIRAQERLVNRAIPFAVLFTRANPAIMPKTQKHIEERFAEIKVPVLPTKLYDREAYRALFSFGGTLSDLRDKGVSNLDTAITNARTYIAEVLALLKAGQGGAPSQVKEVA